MFKPTCGILYVPKPIKKHIHVCSIPSKFITFIDLLFGSLSYGSMYCCPECSQFYMFTGSLTWKKCSSLHDSDFVEWCENMGRTWRRIK